MPGIGKREIGLSSFGLSDTDTDNLYFINDFAGFQTCRPPNKRGGRVSISINELYATTYIKEISFSRPDIETIFAKMSIGNV